MGDQGVGRTAFKRIEKFNDDKTEQVWELFRDEFARASVAEDGETSWRVAAGLMSIDEINKSTTEEDAATIISDIASGSSSSIQVTASWIENKEGENHLTDTGVLLARSAMLDIASTSWSSSSSASECSTRPPRPPRWSLTSSFYDDFLKNEIESCNASRSAR